MGLEVVFGAVGECDGDPGAGFVSIDRFGDVRDESGDGAVDVRVVGARVPGAFDEVSWSHVGDQPEGWFAGGDPPVRIQINDRQGRSNAGNGFTGLQAPVDGKVGRGESRCALMSRRSRCNAASSASERIASLTSFCQITDDGMTLIGADTDRAARIREAHQTFDWMNRIFTIAGPMPGTNEKE